MDLAQLIDALARPAAYPEPVERVEVRQTHISVVFLTGAFAYKIKKPVALDFLDFTTPEKRRHFCEEEVRLNRRLASQVYLGVVPVVRRDARLAVEGDGTAVEWAVKMQRLPGEVTLHEAQASGERLKLLLECRFGISHATLELECHPCDPPATEHAAPN